MMKNEFFHTEFDPSMNSFISQLFLKHIYSLSSPNKLNTENEIGDMNIMEYLFSKLTTQELLDIEKKINNERLYNKEPVHFSNQSKQTQQRKRRATVDQDPWSNMNMFRLFKERLDTGPNIHLSVDKKKRVYAAIDTGLSKYLPRKKKKNFSMMVQMVEQMLNAKEDRDYILTKLDPPPGFKHSQMIKQEAKERKLKIAEEKNRVTQEYEQAEAERKEKEQEKKKMFFQQFHSVLNVEEVKQSPKVVHQKTLKESQDKAEKTVKFITEVPGQSEESKNYDKEVTEIITNEQPKFVDNTAYNKTTSATSNTNVYGAIDAKGHRKDEIINRAGRIR